MVSRYPIQKVVGDAREGLAGQVNALVDTVADDIRVAREWTVRDNRQHIRAFSRTHDGDCGAHRAAKYADARIWKPGISIVERREEIVHLTEAERHWCTQVAAVAAIVEEQHVETSAPEHRADADKLRPAATIPCAADDNTIGFGSVEPPAMEDMLAAGGKRDLLEVRAGLIGTHGVLVGNSGPLRFGEAHGDIVADTGAASHCAAYCQGCGSRGITPNIS